MSSKKTPLKTNSSVQFGGLRGLNLKNRSPEVALSMARKKPIPSQRKDIPVSSSMTPAERRKIILEKMDAKEKHVPFFTTVMGKGGKILLNVYPNRSGRREVQIFFNKGRYDDGLQIVRSCLRNMLSVEFQKIVAVNVYRGFFIAIQTNHTDDSINGYHTDKKYKSNIGLLEFVDLDYVEKFAEDCDAVISPKVLSYLDEVRKYVNICKDVASCFK